MKYLITLIYIAFLFLTIGCSTVSQNPLLQSPKKQSNLYSEKVQKTDTNTSTYLADYNSTTEDEFEDEFEDSDAKEIIDPLNRYNRVMTSFNDGLFIYILTPVSELYEGILPDVVRLGVSNFVHNIKFPIRFTNNLLQGKIINASDELGRFIINSTVGVAGLFDPAYSYFQISAHNEDFGQTLGFYGVGSGFHIVLPFLGPSNVRDLIGLTVDGYISPLIYQNNLAKFKIPKNNLESLGIYGVETINKTSLNLGAYESIRKDAMDLYPFLRDAYEQKRISDIEE